MWKKGYPGQKGIVYHLTNTSEGKEINDSNEMYLGFKRMYGVDIYFSDTIDKCYDKTKGGCEMAYYSWELIMSFIDFT